MGMLIKYKLKLISKNKNSLNKFLKILTQISRINSIQLIEFIKEKKKTKTLLSVLKSPHVNKKAQEQFEYIYYSRKNICFSWMTRKYLMLLKKIKNQLFPEIKIRIESNFFTRNFLIGNKVTNPSQYKYRLKYKRILSKEKMKSKGKNRSILPPKVELLKDLPGDISPLKGEPRSTDLPLNVLLESLPDCTNQQNPNFLTLKKVGLKDKRILSKEKMKSKGKNRSILPPKVELFED